MFNAHVCDPFPTPAPWTRGDWLLLGSLVALKLALHAYNHPAYGYFRDELYYLACGNHLAWGYVDMAPLAAVYAWLAILLGGSLFVVHAIPALAGAGLVALTMALTRELGGGRFALGLAGLVVIVAPVYLVTSSFLSMNAFEPLYWMGCILVLMRILRTDNPRLWLAFGALAGLGLMNKHSTLLFGTAVVVAVVLSPQRRLLLSPWLWAGGMVAALIFLPNLLWQIAHNFPTLEDLRNVQAMGKNVVLSPLEYLGRQVLLMSPILLPLWLAGLWHFLMGRGTRLRVLGYAYVALLAILIGLKGKDYYLAPIYPMLFAAGAVASEGTLVRHAGRGLRIAVQVAVPALIILASIPVTLTMLPVLPPAQWPAFAARFHIPIPRNETGEESILPQYLADRTGWEDLAREVADAFHRLPAEEQRRTAIFAGNYGGAAAVDWFGPRYGLPPAISGHQTYFFWGPGPQPIDQVIILERRKAGLEAFCQEVVELGQHTNPYGMGWENRPILLCRQLRTPLSEFWPKVKFWN